MDNQCLEDSELMDDLKHELMNELMNDEGVLRAALATQGLLINRQAKVFLEMLITLVDQLTHTIQKY